MQDDIYISLAPVDKLLETILPHRARWEHIKLVLPLSHLPDVKGPMPQLRELDLRLPHLEEAETVHVSALRDVPRLSAATLDFTPPTNFLPWSQLTSLTLVATEPYQCTPILTQTVNLVYCKLVIYGDDASQPDIHLPFLECLVLVHFGQDEDPPTQFLNVFVLPALRRLQIPERFFRDVLFWSLSELVSKSGCKLREVCITGRMTGEDVWRRDFASIKFSFNEDLIDWYSDEKQDAFHCVCY
ncbi:F-box domain-containing protein [Mycena venus]|uniref:F-box domain-containing protein n=1 Tax=Mycena venus TaxID=2733690 RepID=A0A8H6X4Y6_9AGAR|nr:F-box domain-containing protein [Mycena venus]